MSLAQSLEAEKAAARKGPPCTFAGIFDKLDKADADTLRSYLADGSVTTTVILRALQAEGFSIGQNTVQRHRRGICACGRA